MYFLRGRSDSKNKTRSPCCPSSTRLPTANNEYLSDGLTESLIGTLSQLPDLKVMARSTVFRFKGKEDDPQKIGQLAAGKRVLMGRVTSTATTWALTPIWSTPPTASELWGSHYERNIGGRTQVQGDITRDISSKLRIHLSGNEQQRLAGPEPRTRSLPPLPRRPPALVRPHAGRTEEEHRFVSSRRLPPIPLCPCLHRTR
jgi:TolB-like protein